MYEAGEEFRVVRELTPYLSMPARAIGDKIGERDGSWAGSGHSSGTVTRSI